MLLGGRRPAPKRFCEFDEWVGFRLVALDPAMWNQMQSWLRAWQPLRALLTRRTGMEGYESEERKNEDWRE